MSRTRSWANAVDANTLFQLLVRESPGKGDNGALGRGVVQKIGTANVVVHGGAIDDGGASFHMLQAVLGEIEKWMNVGAKGVFPLFPAQSGQPLSQDPTQLRESTYSESWLISCSICWNAALLMRISIPPISLRAVSTTFLQFSFFRRSVASK